MKFLVLSTLLVVASCGVLQPKHPRVDMMIHDVQVSDLKAMFDSKDTWQVLNPEPNYDDEAPPTEDISVGSDFAVGDDALDKCIHDFLVALAKCFEKKSQAEVFGGPDLVCVTGTIGRLISCLPSTSTPVREEEIDEDVDWSEEGVVVEGGGLN